MKLESARLREPEETHSECQKFKDISCIEFRVAHDIQLEAKGGTPEFQDIVDSERYSTRPQASNHPAERFPMRTDEQMRAEALSSSTTWGHPACDRDH